MVLNSCLDFCLYQDDKSKSSFAFSYSLVPCLGFHVCNLNSVVYFDSAHYFPLLCACESFKTGYLSWLLHLHTWHLRSLLETGCDACAVPLSTQYLLGFLQKQAWELSICTKAQVFPLPHMGSTWECGEQHIRSWSSCLNPLCTIKHFSVLPWRGSQERMGIGRVGEPGEIRILFQDASKVLLRLLYPMAWIKYHK